jgi:hypothetical protein
MTHHEKNAEIFHIKNRQSLALSINHRLNCLEIDFDEDFAYDNQLPSLM